MSPCAASKPHVVVNLVHVVIALVFIRTVTFTVVSTDSVTIRRPLAGHPSHTTICSLAESYNSILRTTQLVTFVPRAWSLKRASQKQRGRKMPSTD